MAQRLALNIGRQATGGSIDPWRLCATKGDKQNNAVSYGNDWYRQTREVSKRRTTREEIGETNYIFTSRFHHTVLGKHLAVDLFK